jgi:hypothetical protein
MNHRAMSGKSNTKWLRKLQSILCLHNFVKGAEIMRRNFLAGVSSETMKPTWPQQPAFRELVQRWREEHQPRPGKLAPLTELAPLLKVKPRTLTTYLSPSLPQAPSKEFREHAALFFGVPRSVLLDDPFLDLPGLAGENLSPLKRAAAQRILAVLDEPSLTDDQAIELAQRFRDFLTFVVKIKSDAGKPVIKKAME